MGTPSRKLRPLYRGEGRLPVDELAQVHFRDGFVPRPREVPAGSTMPFGGTIPEQILHQAYVGQGAVSLSTCFEVAAAYANHGGKRAKALVFTINSERLAQHLQLFDATKTLEAACPWIPLGTWQPLRNVVRALWPLPHAASQFLEHCYVDAFRRAQIGLGSLAPPPDPWSFLGHEARTALEKAGVRDRDLAALRRAFEEFADFAQQRIGAVDTIRLGSGDGGYTVETRPAGPMVYFEVFARILDDLRIARPDADPGWDLTPLGYIAKTVRDEEVFAAGAVPGELILEAQVVDSAGAPVSGRLLRNPRATPAVTAVRRDGGSPVLRPRD